MVSLRSTLAAAAGLILLAASQALAADSAAFITTWLNVQTNVHSWSADFTQTRTLKTLNQPLTAKGRVYFVAPDRFRWELGEPAQTVAIRRPNDLLVLYPKLQRAEKYPIGADAAGPWRDALPLLEAGFPRSATELNQRFRVLSLNDLTNAQQLVLEPKAPGAKRMMPKIKLEVSNSAYQLTATELHFGDGSILRNDFSNVVTNKAVDPLLFDPVLGPDIRVVEPMNKK
ncbi:MAG TPA: outer membrane lipoprotein carrier protein LolA [Roseimicrobium sp.]|nr:outer membrane lipoprotein carrier protein LolA [Roseimicrobium sp.]